MSWAPTLHHLLFLSSFCSFSPSLVPSLLLLLLNLVSPIKHLLEEVNQLVVLLKFAVLLPDVPEQSGRSQVAIFPLSPSHRHSHWVLADLRSCHKFPAIGCMLTRVAK